jgi:FMN phosphatase YigB (HAD superfamily)
VFVDDIAANVESANRAGLQAVLHKSTAATIAAVDALIAEPPTRRPTRPR